MSQSLVMGSPERALYGCIVTFENENGDTLTMHRTGGPEKGLREACAIALSKDETYRVVSYSTPTTVYGDLRGRAVNVEQAPPSVEAVMLSRLGLLPLLHPRLTQTGTGKIGLGHTHRVPTRRNRP